MSRENWEVGDLLEEGMEEIIIRQASIEDSKVIHQVLAKAFRGLREREYKHRAIDAAISSAEEINERINKGGYVIVAEVCGEIAGTATGLVEHEALHVCSVAVDPDWQGRGIARVLMETMENIAQKQGCHKIWLQTAWVMTEAIALYTRMGYQQEGYLPRHFYGEDFLAFGKVLEKKDDRKKDTSGQRGAILIFPGVEELDFVGVYEVLSKAWAMKKAGELEIESPPEVLLLAREQRVECANGMVVQPHQRYVGLGDFDFVIVPGGQGVQRLKDDKALLADISLFQKTGRMLCSVCTGALVLAWSGVLQGIKATTHYMYRERLKEYCEVVDQRVITDGNITTAAGVSASLDLGLVLLERFYGSSAAQMVAQRIEYAR